MFQEFESLPEGVSNNAIAGVTIGGETHVYTFGGIDESKQFGGIHKRCWHFNPSDNTWSSIPDLPTGAGRIAAGASTVKNKIYIIGGYEVFPNGLEASFDEVHVFDPQSNEFLPDGQSIPIPIDDHVQDVWRDSLIYIVTGWSDDGNVPDVQIYNPTLDNWEVGTSVPNSNFYKVFGGSGVIVQDTIFYLGGARFGSNFPITTHLRKGIINPDDPTEIEWSFVSENMGIGYRSGAIQIGSKIYWIGGSEKTYNYDGIAYDNSGGVEPRMDWTVYDLNTGTVEIVSPSVEDAMPEVMDLRGVVRNLEDQAILVGGMSGNQMVSNKCYEISFDLTNVQEENKGFQIAVYPNPVDDEIFIETEEGDLSYQLMTMDGQIIDRGNVGDRISLDKVKSGIFYLHVQAKNSKKPTVIKLVK